MKKAAEIALYNELRRAAGPSPYAQPGRASIEMITEELAIPAKQAERYLEKWTRAGWWNYGVNLYGGWFEPDAPAVLGEG